MPEAYEYFDMARRCQTVARLAVGSKEAPFTVDMEKFPQFGRRKIKSGLTDVTGEIKRKAMKEHPASFEYDLDSTCPS